MLLQHGLLCEPKPIWITEAQAGALLQNAVWCTGNDCLRGAHHDDLGPVLYPYLLWPVSRVGQLVINPRCALVLEPSYHCCTVF